MAQIQLSLLYISSGHARVVWCICSMVCVRCMCVVYVCGVCAWLLSTTAQEATFLTKGFFNVNSWPTACCDNVTIRARNRLQIRECVAGLERVKFLGRAPQSSAWPCHITGVGALVGLELRVDHDSCQLIRQRRQLLLVQLEVQIRLSDPTSNVHGV